MRLSEPPPLFDTSLFDKEKRGIVLFQASPVFFKGALKVSVPKHVVSCSCDACQMLLCCAS